MLPTNIKENYSILIMVRNIKRSPSMHASDTYYPEAQSKYFSEEKDAKRCKLIKKIKYLLR